MSAPTFRRNFFLLDCDLVEKQRTKPQNIIYQKVQKIDHNNLEFDNLTLMSLEKNLIDISLFFYSAISGFQGCISD